MTLRYTRPESLQPNHAVADFCCGRDSLDQWLRERARRNESAGASRTFVTTHPGQSRVVGYYCLSASGVRLAEAPGAVRRNMPEPIPVILLGRLAVDKGVQGRGLGISLLQDALARALSAASSIGVRAVLVHALDDSASAFYRRVGFVSSPLDDHTLFRSIPDIAASLQAATDSLGPL